MKYLLIACSVAITSLGAIAHDEKCDPIAKEQWRPQAELERLLTDQGWKISRAKITNGCYEVYGRDARNAKKETFFNPKTFKVVAASK
jgi:hypothetical protein